MEPWLSRIRIRAALSVEAARAWSKVEAVIASVSTLEDDGIARAAMIDIVDVALWVTLTEGPYVSTVIPSLAIRYWRKRL